MVAHEIGGVASLHQWREISGKSPDRDLSELIRNEGFECENHLVEAEDGFLITVTRIRGKGMPVLINHGLFIASDAWLLRGQQKDLAFLLAENGYDVWLGDLRGNTYSNSHKTLTPNDPKFWNFSVHEMGVYDLPATIDYILSHTTYDSLQYVGHSLGTTMFFVMCSERPEYMNKVRLMFGLAPAAFFKRSPSLLFKLARQINTLYQDSDGSGRQILPRSQLTGLPASIFCRTSSTTQNICLIALYYLAGLSSLTDFSQIDKELIPEYVRRLPTGASPKTLQHLGQLSKSGRFCQFDYGPKGNLQRYGVMEPPDYNLNQVLVPVALYYGTGDILVNYKDVEELMNRLPNLIRNYTIPSDKFNHMDFLWAKNAKELVYDDMMSIMKNYV
ncbi:lipase 1-like [Lycorma delicatula]|uniref:lipase 1-like n=1 Tax=Lycorma delicatula TaxID=130591 RepID=UPI003F51AA0C